MRRRALLRNSALTATAAVGLAGCTGDGDSGDGDGGDSGGATTTTATTASTSTPTATPTPTATTTSGGEDDLATGVGEVGETPDGLTVVGLESFVEGEGDRSPFTSDGEWGTRVTVENVGDQEAQLVEGRNYQYSMTVYDDAGTELYGGGVGVGTTSGGTVAPGRTKTLTLVPPEDVDPDRIARYVVSITCGTFSEGVYCE